MSGVKEVPAPWKLKGRVWAFALSGIDKKASFPAGFAVPYQAEALTAGGEYIGGPGLVQILSYSESPVGPYDELIYIPGRWKYADGTSAYRITRIYVSTKESTENGRRNWNIPKQVADFAINIQPNGSATIAVTHPGATEPFFKATTKPVTLLSHLPIPVNTQWLGSHFNLIQPPLPAGDAERPEEVATNQWAELVPVMKGKVRLESITGGIGGKLGDGEGFPALLPWRVGGQMASVDLDFGVPTLSDVK